MHVTIAARKEAGCRPNSKGGGVTSAYLKCRRYISVHVRVSSTYYHVLRVCFISQEFFAAIFAIVNYVVTKALVQAYAEKVLIV